MKKFIWFLLLAFCTQLGAVPLRLLFTNDTHAAYQPRNYRGTSGKTYSLGGYLNLERELNKARSQSRRNLTLDSGDEQTGTIFSDYVYNGVKGGAVVEVFNRLGYQAACPGNHEFDQTPADTRGYFKMARYDWVCANVQEDGKYLTGKPYTIFTMDSLKVGVVGLLLNDLPEKVKKDNTAGLTFLPYKQALDKFLPELDKKTDLIIILTHMGREADSLLATQLDNRVDIIMGGHSHDVLEEPLRVNNILITQTGCQLLYLGQMDVDVQGDRIKSYRHKLIPLEDEAAPLTPLAEFINGITADIDHQLGERIGTLTIPWVADKYKETDLSRWQAKALLSAYQTVNGSQFSVINCGGNRNSIQPGPITLKMMQELVPFGNTVTTFSCTGADLYAMFALNHQIARDQPHDMVQAYPFAATYNKDGSVASLTLNGEPVEKERVYRGVSHDYVVNHADKYLGFAPTDVYETGTLFLNVLDDQIRQQKVVGQ